MSTPDTADLFATVVAGGYCVGCGACAVGSDKIQMEFTPLGVYQAALRPGLRLNTAENRQASGVCPFSTQARNEDDIARALFAAQCQPHPEIGYYLQTYAGHVVEDGYRANGSSGGMGTWLIAELLRKDLVDAVIHVKPGTAVATGRRLLFEFAITTDPAELAAGAKSRYYPITLTGVLQQVLARPGLRYAIVGVPCFIKAVRLLGEQVPAIRQAVRFHVGLICGHLKSAAFAELLAWQAGIPPSELTGINFREKLPGRKASKYGFSAQGGGNADLRNVTQPMTAVFGGDWGTGMFKYKACDFCDDVVAETADIVVGDAWLPQFEDDFRGTNVLVVRNRVLDDLVATAMREGRLALEPIGVRDVAKSQQAGLRHRRDGLSWRLLIAQRRGEWHPPKRVAAGSIPLDKKRRSIYDAREELRDLSHAAFFRARATGDVAVFLQDRDMRLALEKYYRAYKPTLLVRVRNRLKRALNRHRPRTAPA